MRFSKKLQKKILNYYERYYRSCGLKDFQERAKMRLYEEEREEQRLQRLQALFCWDFKNKKHLIVGAGTAGLAVVLKQKYNGEVFGIEPSEEELEIIKEKCQEIGLNFSNFKKEFAENISFSTNFFDFVYCITVLEHVQDVEQSIKEMLRVLKPNGFLYVDTPNYTFPFERHYKIVFPTFLPKFLGKIYLALRSKPIDFINSINFLTEKKVNKILMRQKNIKWLRIYQSNFLFEKKGLKGFLMKILTKNLFIYPNQEIIIQKL